VSATIDVNVLIYASNAADPAHGPARQLVERLAAGPDLLYLFWPTLMGYLRIGTHPGILPRPLAPRDAMANVSELLALPHVRSPGEREGFWDLFRATAGGNPRGDDVPDAYLATLMRQHGVGVIFTRDRGFRRYNGIQIRDPFER
jgi:toxin-antitoxin system PIN domain toxin